MYRSNPPSKSIDYHEHDFVKRRCRRRAVPEGLIFSKASNKRFIREKTTGKRKDGDGDQDVRCREQQRGWSASHWAEFEPDRVMRASVKGYWKDLETEIAWDICNAIFAVS